MLNKRKPCVRLTDTNCNIIPLNVAAERAAETGAFLLAEKSGIASFEGDSPDISPDNIRDMNIGKIDAALRGLDFVKEATAEKTGVSAEPDVAPAAEPVSAPAAE